MASPWITVAPGIRARDHDTRKHGVKLDRYFTVRFSAGGRQIEEALGWASEGWTLKRAQEELGKLREAQRTGEGPATLRERAEKKRADEDVVRRETSRAAEALAQLERQEKTVTELWERYLAEVVAVENRGRTVVDKHRIWSKRIQPAIGALKIKDITEADVVALVHAPFKFDKAGQVVGGKAEAANIYRFLHHLFVKANAWGLRPQELGNPLQNVHEPKVKRRERLLTGSEIGALMRVLDEAVTEDSEHVQVAGVIRAAILTGARITELLTLRWDAVRREDMELNLADTKTGFSRRPMSGETLNLLDSLGQMPGSAFVFRGIEDPTKPLDYYYVNKAFGRFTAAAGISGVSLHTIRHWFATMTANSVSNPRVGMALTGHKSHQAYMTYIHGDKEQARALADQLAALSRGLGQAQPKVIEITHAKKKA
jgi:integrase